MSVWQSLSSLATAVSDGGSKLLAHITGATPTAAGERAQHSVAFTIAVIALSAKMAKADGVVAGVEVEAFYKAFQVDAAELAHVRQVFEQAQADTVGFEGYASQIARLLGDDRAVLADVLDTLFHIATADRALHPAEDAFLQTVALRFGLTETEFRQQRARYVFDPTSPYVVLGLHPAVGDLEVKARHRKLVREHHPDLAIGRGLPPDMIATATRKLAAINDAYAIIARERHL